MVRGIEAERHGRGEGGRRGEIWDVKGRRLGVRRRRRVVQGVSCGHCGRGQDRRGRYGWVARAVEDDGEGAVADVADGVEWGTIGGGG